MALVATGGLLGSQIIIGIIAMYDATYEAQRWRVLKGRGHHFMCETSANLLAPDRHQFLIYIGYNIAAFLINAFGNAILPRVNQTAIIWSISGFAVICIAVLACSSPNYNAGDTVYREFINTTGWPDGIAWLLGLLQGALGLTGFDATAHMIEEIPNAAIEGPKIMIYAVGIGTFTGFVFLSCLLFVAGDLNKVIESSAGPLNQIILNATGNKAGTVCLLMFPLICMLFATTSIMTTSSRMTYAFARDGGLPFSRFFSRVHQKLDVPLEALGLTNLVVLIFGLIFLGSTSAFNAITSASVVALGLSYGIPPAINILRGRRMLPKDRPFRLPEPIGWFVNIAGVAFTILTTVLFVFPPELPVTGNNMNYCIAAFAIVFIISLLTWIFDGRKNYRGPKIDIDENILVATASPEMEEPGSQKTGKDSTDKVVV